MVQLDILTGNKAGTAWTIRRLPFRLGRSASAALILEEPGVWDRHAEFTIRSDEGVILTALDDAVVLVNGRRIDHVALRNGDLIEAGSVRMRFGFSPTRQRGLGLRETLTWVGLAAICLGQVALIYWLAE